jgi:tetratricopeptide (TPR) repeat protein
MKSKIIFIGLLLASIWIGLSADLFAGDLSPFAEANSKYQSGDFKEALSLYEGSLQASKETSALDYNLGNTHFRLGHKGKALIYYERALRISPRDPDVLWNIQIVKTAVADRIDRQNDNLIIVWIRGIVDQMTVNEVSMIVSLFLFFWVLISVAAFIAPVIKPFTRGLGILILCCFLIACVLFGFKWIECKDPHLIVLDKEAVARYGPSDRETKAFTLHEGAEAKIVDESKDWFCIQLPDGNSGWIPRKSCEII